MISFKSYSWPSDKMINGNLSSFWPQLYIAPRGVTDQ